MGDLSADQRAILELVLERDLEYEAIGDVTGIGADEARERARAGIGALGAGEPDQDLADYLLGRASAGPRVGVRARLQSDATYNALARDVATLIRAEFPDAALPEIPGGQPPRQAPGAKRVPLGLLAGGVGVVCMILAGLLFAGVFGGDEDEPELPAESAVEPSEPVEIPLEPPGGGQVGGTATIGLDDQSEPFLTLDIQNLPEAPSGEIYMLWVDDGLGRGLPLPSPLRISKDGSLQESFRVAPELIPILDLGKNLELITVGREQLQNLSEDVTQAGKVGGDEPPSPEDLPQRPGGVVLTGTIPDR